MSNEKDHEVDIVKALYDYEAEDETCISLEAGDIIYVINKDESGWHDGVISSGPNKGKRGWFPSNFTKAIEHTPPTSPASHDIPAGWKQKIAKDGNSYYFNLSTYQTVNSKEEIPKNPRQSMLLLKASSTDFEELRNLNTVDEKIDENLKIGKIQPTWDILINRIFKGISDLNSAAKTEEKSKFLVSTTDVIKGIREMLIASNCLSKNSLMLKQHSSLRTTHSQLLSATAKLVLAAKVASGIYPQPKSTTKMRYQAGQVLLSVRHFVSAAQENKLTLEGFAEEEPEDDESNKIPMSDFDFVKRLDSFSNNVLTTATEMISILFQDQTNKEKIISISKDIVFEVGQIFSLIDELKLGNIRNKEMTALVDDFKEKREVLYEKVNDLVSNTSTLLDSFAPANSQQLLQKCSSNLMRASENLVTSTKILIDKKEDYEQQILEQEIQIISDPKRDSDLLVLQRRAMSLTYVPVIAKTDESESPNPLVKSVSQDLNDIADNADQSLKTRSSASRVEYNKDHENLALRASENSARLLNKNISRSRNSIRRNLAYLTYDYSSKDLILNLDGQVSGGTLEALIERLTLHDMTIDPLYITSFLQTFRLFTSQTIFLKLLEQRFNLSEPTDLQVDEIKLWTDKKLIPVRLRVFNILKTWMEGYFYVEDELYFSQIESFSNLIIRPAMPSMAIRIIDVIKKQKERDLQIKLSVPSSSTTKSHKSSKISKYGNIAQTDYTDVAKQITLIEIDMFSRLKPEDLISYVFSKDKNEKVSAMTKFSTNVMYINIACLSSCRNYT
eukprot:NODE_379_length_8451_cov_0.593630.p1 type:complete len:787 gc:universal NODE_379_length_8451_cov_0.593630:7008-4648(-)